MFTLSWSAFDPRITYNADDFLKLGAALLFSIYFNTWGQRFKPWPHSLVILQYCPNEQAKLIKLFPIVYKQQ